MHTHPKPASRPHIALFRADAVFDWRGRRGDSLLVLIGPNALPRVLAVGSRDEVVHHPLAAAAEHVHRPGHIILPGLVNAHTHLDLTHIGPKPHDPARGFVTWVSMVRAHRRLDPPGVTASIARGVELSLAGGTVAVGDIAGGIPDDAELTPWRALCRSPLLGISYQELFGIGNRRVAAPDRIAHIIHAASSAKDHGLQRLGLQPHAPYTVDLRVYRLAVQAALAADVPLATHLAETPEERQVIARATGPLRDLLASAGIWDDSVEEHLGLGLHPVQHMAEVLAHANLVVAHANDADDAAIETLARTGTSVAYCPRASEYFGAAAHFGQHRYREMIEVGVNVALGTDSLINLPESAARPDTGGMSILDEVRRLYQRDGTDPLLLLRMATRNGAQALRLPTGWFQFDADAELAGALAVPFEPSSDSPATILELSLRCGEPGELLFLRNLCCWARNEAVPSPLRE
jgi:aminodeoxyfutalosine deaminase